MHRLSVLAFLVAVLALAGAAIAGPLATTAVAQQQNPPCCADSDGDGYPDYMDDCPTQPGTSRARGCPDADGDSVADKDDKCPTVAGDQQNGCPPDDDADGVPDDGTDKCPDVYGPDRPDGCMNPVGEAGTNYGTLAHVARNVNPATILCNDLPSGGGGCFFDVSLRLTPASARALGVKDRTVWHVHGEVDRYIDNGTAFGYGKFSNEAIHVSAAMKRALRSARRATFELSGTFHWGHERVQTLKDADGHAVSRFTKTRKLDRAGAYMHTPYPPRAPKS